MQVEDRVKLLLRAMTTATVSGRHLKVLKSVDFKVNAVVDCIVDGGRCDRTGNEVKMFAETAVCMPRSLISRPIREVCSLHPSLTPSMSSFSLSVNFNVELHLVC